MCPPWIGYWTEKKIATKDIIETMDKLAYGLENGIISR